MSRFLADVGVSGRVVSWLRNNGHDVVRLVEDRLHRMPDENIFAKCHRESRILLTFDLDFGEIIASSRGVVVSVVLFRLTDTSPPFLIRRLDRVLQESLPALTEGAIIVVEDGRHRVRRLPFGS